MTSQGLDLRDYSVECDGSPVNLGRLRSGHMPEDVYSAAHRGLVICCHDIYLSTPDEEGEIGLLLVKRLQEPAKGAMWPIGGRVLRGMSTQDSLRHKVKEECGLDAEDTSF